LIRFDII